MTQSEFENKLIEVLEDCAKSLRAQVKIMQDRNFLLEQTNTYLEQVDKEK